VNILKLGLILLILGVGISSVAQVQSSLDRPRVVIDAVEFEGAAHLPETVKKQLVDSLQQHEYEESSDWIRDVEAHRQLFWGNIARQLRAYARAEVRWNPLSEVRFRGAVYACAY
jgi:hypothetical protein